MTELPFRRTASGISITIRLTPNSSRNEISATQILSDGRPALLAYVRAHAEKGKANTALLKLIATWLEVPAARVGLLSGRTSRLKQVSVSGDTAQLASIFEARIKELKRK